MPLLALEIIHIVGWAVGLVLVAIGLWVARVTSRWIPLLLVVSIAGLVVASGVALMVVVAIHVVALAALAAQLPRAIPTDEALTPSAVSA